MKRLYAGIIIRAAFLAERLLNLVFVNMLSKLTTCVLTFLDLDDLEIDLEWLLTHRLE